MILPVILHIISLETLFFGLVSVCGVPIPVWAVACALVCGAGACVLRGFARQSWGFVLALVLCAVPLVFLRSAGDAVYLLPSSGYVLLLVLEDRADTDDWVFRKHFAVAGPVAAVIFWAAFGKGTNGHWTSGLMMASLLSGVMFLRSTRLGPARVPQRLMDLGWTVAVPTAVLAVVGFFTVFSQQLKTLLHWILAPFAALMSLIIGAFTLIRFDPTVELEPTTEATTQAAEETIWIPPETSILQEAIPEGGGYNLFPVVGGIAALGLVVLLIFLLARLLHRTEKVRGGEETLGTFSTFTPQQTPRQLSEANRKKIRKTYIKYLRLMGKRGYVFRARHTSRDVFERSEAYADSEAAQRLRKIYIRARYNTDLPVSAEDVKEAKAIYNVIKESE